MYALDGLPWRELVESLSSLDGVLRLDPAGVYGRMDFETRDEYRRAAERISRRSRVSEEHVGRLAIELRRGLAGDVERRADGSRRLLLAGAWRRAARATRRLPGAGFHAVSESRRTMGRLVYPGGIGPDDAGDRHGTRPMAAAGASLVLVLLIVPASQAAVAIVNGIVHASIAPGRLPRLDFSDGVPDDCRTFIVVPTLLLSRANVETLVERLEIHYLANRDPNLRFALLTDGPDAEHQKNR